MSYSVSFDVFRNNCKHFYLVSTMHNTKINRCKILTKIEFNGRIKELHNLEEMTTVNCVEDQCPILNNL